MFLWHFPWGRPPWPLASTLPCGARTFLPPCCHGRRPSDLLWRVLQYSAAARRKRRAPASQRLRGDRSPGTGDDLERPQRAHQPEPTLGVREPAEGQHREDGGRPARQAERARGGGEDFGQQTERRQRHGGGGGRADGGEGGDRESGGEGKSVDLGGGRII